jgi:hypothetical protein
MLQAKLAANDSNLNENKTTPLLLLQNSLAPVKANSSKHSTTTVIILPPSNSNGVGVHSVILGGGKASLLGGQGLVGPSPSSSTKAATTSAFRLPSRRKERPIKPKDQSNSQTQSVVQLFVQPQTQPKRKQTKKASKIVAITRKKKAEIGQTSKKKLARLDSQAENNKIEEKKLLNNQESKFSRTLFGEMKLLRYCFDFSRTKIKTEDLKIL